MTSPRDADKEATQRALIVVPTYNERNNLERFVAEVRRAAPRADVLIVDDGSPDGTGDLADELARADPNVSVLHRPKKLGLGTAYVEAFSRGMSRGYDFFFEMDADFSHDPKYIPDFFRAFDEGADVVVASRNVEGGRVEGWGWGRHAISKGGSLYSRLILGVGVRDLTAGYKAYTRRALETIGLDSIRSNGYSFQIETTYRALQKGLKVVEIPTVFVDRRAGESKMSRKIFIEAIGVVWRLRLQALRGQI